MTCSAFLLVLAFLSGCTFQSHVIQVTLVNKGDTDARNIEFRYPGGSFGVSSLAPGKTYDYRIKPFYSGAVEIEYTYGQAKIHSMIAKVEKEQAGRATVAIEATGAKWEGSRPH